MAIFAFAQSLAVFAAENYGGRHVSSVMVTFTGTRPLGRPNLSSDPPLVFIPEYQSRCTAPAGFVNAITLASPSPWANCAVVPVASACS